MRLAISRRENVASGTPSSETAPRLGASVPDSRRTRVVLPEPFGPISPTIEPRVIANDTPSSTRGPRGYANERSVAVSNAFLRYEIHGPASGSLDVPLASQP